MTEVKRFVTPEKAGVQTNFGLKINSLWIPAAAGMTKNMVRLLDLQPYCFHHRAVFSEFVLHQFA
jgi:hypothetical protein